MTNITPFPFKLISAIATYRVVQSGDTSAFQTLNVPDNGSAIVTVAISVEAIKKVIFSYIIEFKVNNI